MQYSQKNRKVKEQKNNFTIKLNSLLIAEEKKSMCV